MVHLNRGWDGDGQYDTVDVYRFDDHGEAQAFTERLTEHSRGSAMSLGGWPGPVCLLDTADAADFDDPAELRERWAEYEDDE